MALDIIVVNHERGRVQRLRFDLRSLRGCLAVVLAALVMVGGAYLAGRLSVTPVPMNEIGVAASDHLQDEIYSQRQELLQARELIDQNMLALAKRVGRLQAHMTRLNAVGMRLTEMAQIAPEEFDFENEPALGGPASGSANSGQQSMADLLVAIDEFSKQLDQRERDMQVLQEFMVAGRLREQNRPTGLPVERGWISSGFGMRTDPFTGRRARHNGVDLPGHYGSDVIAVASGVVTYAGHKGGYGKLVEINHGNGYTTRYGHNSKLLVRVGQQVGRGQPIAAIGSSGRSTGAHVHFEVLLNGRAVNPAAYIYASR